ncbi:hypothetical protein AZH51_02260 [Branchiibius sp. NY16-3462-2]|nr:hypothetical protein AZH51_02260 [Branchiibius sp. NY16-3462-2]
MLEPPTEHHRVTQFELFFDLVFVFAFTQVTALMAHEHDAASVLRGLTVLGILWWSWAPYTWLANRARADRGLTRLGMAFAAAAVFVIALAMPDAFAHTSGPNRAAFLLVACYLIVRVIHVGLSVLAAGDNRHLQWVTIRTFAISLTPTFLLLFLGATLGGSIQAWLWIAAWFVDLTLVLLVSRGGKEWRIGSVVHWAERYSLVVMLAVGKSVVSVGVGLREVEVDTGAVAGACLAIGGAFLLWWTYFDRFAPAAEEALALHTGAARAVAGNRAFLDLHYVIVAGVILTALGVEGVMAHITDSEPLGWFGALTLCGGVSVFLLGTVLVWLQRTGNLLVGRTVLAVVLIPASSLYAVLPPVAGLSGALIIGAGLLTFEARSHTFENTIASSVSERNSDDCLG